MTWSRDRLGYYAPAQEVKGAHCISSPIALRGHDARVFVNATGLAEEGTLVVEILDEAFRPLPGYAAADFVPIAAKSGYRVPVALREHETLAKNEQPIRVRVNWVGGDAEKTRLFAVYVEEKEK